MSKRFAEYLKEQRDRLSLSQDELGEKIGATKGYISRLESGKVMPSESMIERMAALLGDRPERLRFMCGKLGDELERAIALVLLDAPIGCELKIVRDNNGSFKLCRVEPIRLTGDRPSN